MACAAHASLPIGTPNRRRVISPSSSLTRRAGGDRVDSPQTEGDATPVNGVSGGIGPTGWRAGILGDLQGGKILRQRALAEGIYGLHGFAAIALVAVSIGAIAAGALAYQTLWAPVPMTGPFSDPPASANVSILTENSRFTPSAFNVTAFTTTRITVLNEDDAPHTFTYVNNGTTYNHDLPGGSTTRFFVLFLAPGTVPFWSIPDRSGGMVGNITVNSA